MPRSTNIWSMPDAYVIEKKFLVSAEGRKLHRLAAEQSGVYEQPLLLRTVKKARP
jgi:DNA gyrase subunit B